MLEGVGKVDALPPPPFTAESDGTVALECDTADLYGKGLRVEGNTRLNLTDWKNAEAYPQWEVQFDKPGTYELSVLCFVPDTQAGSEFVVTIGDQKVAGRTTATGGDFKEVALGKIRVEKTGPMLVKVTPTRIAAQEFMRLRTLTAKPVSP